MHSNFCDVTLSMRLCVVKTRDIILQTTRIQDQTQINVYIYTTSYICPSVAALRGLKTLPKAAHSSLKVKGRVCKNKGPIYNNNKTMRGDICREQNSIAFIIVTTVAIF